MAWEDVDKMSEEEDRLEEYLFEQEREMEAQLAKWEEEGALKKKKRKK